MRTKLLCLVFLFVLLAVSVFAASPSLGTFKRGSCVDLKQTCASCSYVNFTRVSYPNGSVALENVQAEKRGYVFNYTFCNTDALGTYLVEGVGDVNGEDTVFVYDFEITPDGKPISPLRSSVYFILSFVFFGLAIYLFYRMGKAGSLTSFSLYCLCGCFSLFIVFQMLLLNPVVITTDIYDIISESFSIFSVIFSAIIIVFPALIIFDLIKFYKVRKNKEKLNKWNLLLEDET